MDRIYWFVNLRKRCSRKRCLKLVSRINQNVTLSMIRLVIPLYLEIDRLIAVNVVGARDFGWKEVCHLLFPEDIIPPPQEGVHQIHGLGELQKRYPSLFRKRT